LHDYEIKNSTILIFFVFFYVDFEKSGGAGFLNQTMASMENTVEVLKAL